MAPQVFVPLTTPQAQKGLTSMLNLNSSTLAAVVDKALADAAEHPRWVAAINRAVTELVSNPWVERGELHGLVIASPSGKVYSANGTCQCEAHSFGNACWHRAAARLVRLHDEAEQAQSAAAEQAAFQALAERTARRLAAAKATALMNELYA